MVTNYCIKHVFQPYTMNFVDEQAGERSHKRHKFSRPHLSRKSSAEDNLTDMMRAALAWSDPKMSYLEFMASSKRKQRRNDEKFEAQIAEYIDSEADVPPTTDSCSIDNCNNDSDDNQNESNDDDC